MGNVCQSSQVRLRPEFQQCCARTWGIKDLRRALEQVEALGASKGGAAFSTLRLQNYMSIFEHDDVQAKRQFRLLCERASVTDLARAKPKCSGLTALTSFCFLSCATSKEKAHFLFNLFDLNNSELLTYDETLVMITCLFRALSTLDVDSTQYCQATDLESMAQEPFIVAGLNANASHLTKKNMWRWAKEAMMRLGIFAVCLLPSRSPTARQRPRRRPFAPRRAASPPPVHNNWVDSPNDTASNRQDSGRSEWSGGEPPWMLFARTDSPASHAEPDVQDADRQRAELTRQQRLNLRKSQRRTRKARQTANSSAAAARHRTRQGNEPQDPDTATNTSASARSDDVSSATTAGSVPARQPRQRDAGPESARRSYGSSAAASVCSDDSSELHRQQHPASNNTHNQPDGGLPYAYRKRWARQASSPPHLDTTCDRWTNDTRYEEEGSDLAGTSAVGGLDHDALSHDQVETAATWTSGTDDQHHETSRLDNEVDTPNDEEDAGMTPLEAIKQILDCLPDIEEGDLASLPWVLDALSMLSKCENCGELREYIPAVLPLICNVAACEDSTLSCDALHVLAAIVDGAAEMVASAVESVNDKAVLEMCLVKSTDPDIAVAAAADLALARIAARLPYGFGPTLASLLEVGTLHEMPGVVRACADTVVKSINSVLCEPEADGSRPPLDPSLEGRARLLLSALSVWAHGPLEDCRDASKLIVLRLSIHFADNDEWAATIEATQSPVLLAWHNGNEPDASDFEHQAPSEHPTSQQSDLEKHGGVGDVTNPLAARCWLVPAGTTRNPLPAPPNAMMYPQVFAVLGFQGAGGPAVGVAPNSEFNCMGSFRKKETVKEARTVEFAKVLEDGSIKVWVEHETQERQVVHFENPAGHFARRERLCERQHEVIDGREVTNASDAKDFVHVRNARGEFSSFVRPKDLSEDVDPDVDADVCMGENQGNGPFEGGMIPSPRRAARAKRSGKTLKVEELTAVVGDEGNQRGDEESGVVLVVEEPPRRVASGAHGQEGYDSRHVRRVETQAA